MSVPAPGGAPATDDSGLSIHADGLGSRPRHSKQKRLASLVVAHFLARVERKLFRILSLPALTATAGKRLAAAAEPANSIKLEILKETVRGDAPAIRLEMGSCPTEASPAALLPTTSWFIARRRRTRLIRWRGNGRWNDAPLKKVGLNLNNPTAGLGSRHPKWRRAPRGGVAPLKNRLPRQKRGDACLNQTAGQFNRT